jgi:hypothetical protein
MKPADDTAENARRGQFFAPSAKTSTLAEAMAPFTSSIVPKGGLGCGCMLLHRIGIGVSSVAALAAALSGPCACRRHTKHSTSLEDTQQSSPRGQDGAQQSSPRGQDGAQQSSIGGQAGAASSHPPSSAATPLDCPHFSQGHRTGKIANSDLIEASDLVASSRNPGVLWSHNDSGGKPRLFALGTNGTDLGTYHLEGATLEDWEDLAVGPGPSAGKSYLYVGDIGANARPRERISVYRVEEPTVSLEQKPKKRQLHGSVRFDFVYPDHSSHDAESLMIDPRTSDLYLVTKPRKGAPVVYRQRAPLDAQKEMVLESVTTLNSIASGPLLPTLVTSGDIARDGSMILLRTYSHAYLWPRRDGESIDTALERPPCFVPLHTEPQGEAIGFAADGKGYYTTSEGGGEAIRFYARKD